MLTVKSDQSERILEAGITEQAVKEMITGSASFLSPVSSISQTRLSFLSFLLEDKTLAPGALSSCSFIPRAYFESCSVMVSFYGKEILHHK